jgi:hypothetical protein
VGYEVTTREPETTMSAIQKAAIEWIRKNTTLSTTGTEMVSESAYDTITDEELREAVSEFIGDFRVPSGGEYAYARVQIDEEE